MKVSAQEFERLPLRVHAVLAGVPLHDVWAVDLPPVRSGITLDEFLRTAGTRPFVPSPAARALLRIRFLVGRLLGWDLEPRATPRDTFATGVHGGDRSLPQVDRLSVASAEHSYDVEPNVRDMSSVRSGVGG